MPNTLRVKRRASGGAAGAPSSLANAELAYNEQDTTLYIGEGTGGAGGSATSIRAIAGPGAFTTLGTTQTVTGNKTFSGVIEFTGSVSGIGGSGTVTSVALSLPNIFTVSGSPVTSTGTLTGALATQTPNSVFAGPSTGSTAIAPTFRALVSDDIPTLTAAKISDFNTQVQTSRLDQMAAPTSSVSFNSQRITGLADPSSAQDAATKAYVDATRQGLDVKDSVLVATTANITLSGTQTVDGVSLSVGNRVLVKNQSTAGENGIYVVAAGAWARAADANSATNITPGLFTFVEQGTANADSGWVLTTDGSITVGTTGLTFVQFSGAGQITAGTGLAKTGNTIEITTVPAVNGGTGLTTAAQGSVLVANTANTYTALDGGGSTDKLLLYTASTDTISWTNEVDGGTF